MKSPRFVLGAAALSLLMLGAAASAQDKTPARAAASPAPAAAVQPAKEKWDAYKILYTNNMFTRDRPKQVDSNPRMPPPPPIPTPEENTVLRGIVRQGEGADSAYFVFLEDMRTHDTTKMRVGDPVCSGKLVNPTYESVDYEKPGAAPRRIELGRDLTGAEPPPPVAAPSTLTGATPAGTTGATTTLTGITGATGTAVLMGPPSSGTGASSAGPAANLDDVMAKLREKRRKELGK